MNIDTGQTFDMVVGGMRHLGEMNLAGTFSADSLRQKLSTR